MCVYSWLLIVGGCSFFVLLAWVSFIGLFLVAYLIGLLWLRFEFSCNLLLGFDFDWFVYWFVICLGYVVGFCGLFCDGCCLVFLVFYFRVCSFLFWFWCLVFSWCYLLVFWFDLAFACFVLIVFFGGFVWLMFDLHVRLGSLLCWAYVRLLFVVFNL